MWVCVSVEDTGSVSGSDLKQEKEERKGEELKYR